MTTSEVQTWGELADSAAVIISEIERRNDDKAMGSNWLGDVPQESYRIKDWMSAYRRAVKARRVLPGKERMVKNA